MHKNYLYSLKYNGFMDKEWWELGLYTDHTEGDIHVPTKEEFDKFCPLSPVSKRPEGKRLGFDKGITWVDCEFYMEDMITNTRATRDRLLTKIDNVVGNPLRYDALSENEKKELREYRKLLLDVPQQDGFPTDVTFPATPQCLVGKRN